MRARADLFKAGLNALYVTGAHRLLEPYAAGAGLIFTLHQVGPEPASAFAPNRILSVTPEFLDSVLEQTRVAGLEIVSLDEARERLKARGRAGRFACFTLDDGYRDNLECAWPVFRKHDAPFAIYVPSAYADGRGELWWLALEEVVARSEAVQVPEGMGSETLPTQTVHQKQVAFERIYWWLRSVTEEEQRAAMRALCASHVIDMGALCRDLIMSWDEIGEMARDPLVTIGAHTVNHYALAKLPEADARLEMDADAEAIGRRLGARPRHISYPYGDPASAGAREFKIAAELGFATGVTCRKGVLFPEHRDHMTALPRVSLNGAYQSLRYTELYLTGAPFALWNRFRKVDAA